MVVVGAKRAARAWSRTAFSCDTKSAANAEAHFAVSKAHDAGVSKGAEELSIQPCAQRLGRVVDEDETPPATELLDGCNSRGVAEEMRDDHRPRARSGGGFHCLDR